MKKIILSTFVASSFLFAADYTNSIGMVFKEIPSGSFMMGTKSTADCLKNNPHPTTIERDRCHSEGAEIPEHEVTLKGFYMAETEVTQGQWYEVMGNNPAKFKTGDANMPVEQVNWDDTQEFIKRLNQKEGGKKYRLPTEEEWEYAARAGTTTKWYCGDNESCVDSIAVYGTSSPKPVKSKKPNAWGLYDMSGNVWEFTGSCWTDDYNSAKDCGFKVYRGGSWYNKKTDFTGLDSMSSTNRIGYRPDKRFDFRGFRIIRMK